MKSYKTGFLILILLLADCKKPNGNAPLAFSDLPFKQGNSWIYSRYDSAVNVHDTVTITIPAVYVRNDTTTYLWVQSASGIIDTAYLLLINDTLYGQTNSNGDPVPALYQIVFPLTNGSNWYFDFASCSLVNQLEINNVSYHNIYQVHWQSFAFIDFPAFQNIYFAKGVGVVRYNQNTSPAAYAVSNLLSTNYQWDLLSYHLN